MKTVAEMITLHEHELQTLPMSEQNPVYAAVAAAYWAGQSDGQEKAESKIRAKLETLPENRYHGVQTAAIEWVLADNPCAMRAPRSLSRDELLGFDFDL
jgi:CBS-domain-containing membrane protein